ncbi:MAG: AAA family ATPase [Candidatus Latescibacterota bacterium]|nr:MAG: AAA family ATPase [Candidatus Latescibacterota bacterium]
MPRGNRSSGSRLRSIHRMVHDDNIPLEEKFDFLVMIRAEDPQSASDVDRFFLRECARLRGGLREAEALQAQLVEAQKELEESYKKLTAPPLYPATFLEFHTIGEIDAALVSYASGLRFVRLADGFDGARVRRGDQVLLSAELNLLVGSVSCTQFGCGETVTFERYTDDGRLVVSRRDEEIVVNASDDLRAITLKQGDELRWSPSGQMAFEKIDSPTAEHLYFDDATDVTFDDIGGLDAQAEELRNLVLLHLEHPELTAVYGLKPRRGAVLEGPPGTGKTMLVKALVNFLKTLSPTGQVKLINVKPGELGSIWYSETERKIRELFRMAHEAADAEPGIPVIIFFDEVDWIATSRGGTVHRVDDRAVGTLAVELDGLRNRGNVLVLAATNRMDMLDPALIRPERFGDKPIRVDRPNRVASRAILSKYFHDGLPYAVNDESSLDVARETVVDATLSRLFAPNGDGDVATVTFRDGTKRTVGIRDVISGAILAKLANDAGQRACLREIGTGERGIRLDDVYHAIDEAIANAANLLTPTNCSKYVSNLPQDIDVVSVEPIRRKTTQLHHYFRAA